MERVALIDLGSNTARLVIYDILDGGYFVVFEDRHEAVRLGETEIDGSLKQTRIMQAIATLKTFKEMCAIKKVDKILAVATAAVRSAANQKTFLSDVYNATGIRVTVVSEEEEANYVYQGVINSMEIPRGLIMEIGGGHMFLAGLMAMIATMIPATTSDISWAPEYFFNVVNNIGRIFSILKLSFFLFVF